MWHRDGWPVGGVVRPDPRCLSWAHDVCSVGPRDWTRESSAGGTAAPATATVSATEQNTHPARQRGIPGKLVMIMSGPGICELSVMTVVCDHYCHSICTKGIGFGVGVLVVIVWQGCWGQPDTLTVWLKSLEIRVKWNKNQNNVDQINVWISSLLNLFLIRNFFRK